MIDWSTQHCGVKKAPFSAVVCYMPDIIPVLDTFPEDPSNFTWDVKVHMLMPRQYPCIPHWHVDNVPRDVDGRQEFHKVQLDKPMWMWISGGPLTEFRNGYIRPETWVRFTQADEHRGTPASEFTWRAFIRATHVDIMKPRANGWLRRHCQVYCSPEYQW